MFFTGTTCELQQCARTWRVTFSLGGKFFHVKYATLKTGRIFNYLSPCDIICKIISWITTRDVSCNGTIPRLQVRQPWRLQTKTAAWGSLLYWLKNDLIKRILQYWTQSYHVRTHMRFTALKNDFSTFCIETHNIRHSQGRHTAMPQSIIQTYSSQVCRISEDGCLFGPGVCVPFFHVIIPTRLLWQGTYTSCRNVHTTHWTSCSAAAQWIVCHRWFVARPLSFD